MSSTPMKNPERENPFNISKPKELINFTICLFLRYMTTTNLFILTCRSFGLFLIKETPELYLFFMIYLQNEVLSTRHALMGCDTTSEVVTKKKSY